MARSGRSAALVESDEFAQYSLRATFFVRKLRELALWEAIAEVHALCQAAAGFSWDERPNWGVSESAFARLAQKSVNPLLLFCHPRALREQPKLLLYYRTVALLSQKGLAQIVGGDVAKVEDGRVEQPAQEWIEKTVTVLNGMASAIVEMAADVCAEELCGWQFATAGATIQGAWNNAVGTEGERTVQTLLIKYLAGEISQIVWRNGRSSDYGSIGQAAVIDQIADTRVIRLKQGFHLAFGSEPDVSLRDPHDLPIVAVEVKAGTDPAGALERLGAAIKSFENDRNRNPRVRTVYVVRCVTPELRRRISEGGFFDHTFSLAELLTNVRTQQTFANLFRRAVLGHRNRVPKR